ncbi:isochorismatase family protein [Sandaracinobacteroides saxicola]|uniref:Isochorismatase family protein n=1 Tax=Sandaracinobacteroides saxicola TaxID=2759707 RepID=A0A7G5IE88_9SPHN|nr:isochorismatase family protein [Sandaracinobacteroides saxicola]QMW21680.1 isochorismatase family protein [Sandaracinobacteroides saxicola]
MGGDAPTPDPSPEGEGRSLLADYAAAGFGASMGFGRRPVVIVVDFALAYLDRASPLFADVEDALAVNVALVAAARAAGVRIVFTRVDYAEGGLEGGLFYRKVKALACFDRGNPWGGFDPRLEPAPGDVVVTKHYPSAFFGTSLASMLTAMGVDTAIVTGLSTSGCVRATALDALCHGFYPIVVRDACGDRSAAVHEANLFDLQAKYADVVGSEVVMDYLRGLA